MSTCDLFHFYFNFSYAIFFLDSLSSLCYLLNYSKNNCCPLVKKTEDILATFQFEINFVPISVVYFSLSGIIYNYQINFVLSLIIRLSLILPQISAKENKSSIIVFVSVTLSLFINFSFVVNNHRHLLYVICFLL